MKAVYVFVGYDKHWVDGIAPIIGKYIEKRYDVPVLFCNQQEIKATYDKLKSEYKDYYSYAFDVGVLKGYKRFIFCKGGFAPASMIVPEQDVHIGDMGIIINVDGIADKESFTSNNPDKNRLKKRNKIIKLALKNIVKLVEANMEETECTTNNIVEVNFQENLEEELSV